MSIDRWTLGNGQDVVLELAWTLWGTEYIWGGDDPSGFDCSGMVLELLQSVGAYPRGQDTTANGLMHKYRAIKRGDVTPTDLVFWVNANGKAYHVGMVIAPNHLYIGAEGGGSSTKTLADAHKRNAYIKIRPIDSRGTEDNRRYARWRD